MKIEELYRRLSVGPLRNLAMGMDGEGDITTSWKPTIIFYANETLRALHTKFKLREAAVIIEQQAGRTQYPLEPQYSYQNAEQSGEANPFIVDTVGSPFQGHVIQILHGRDIFGNVIPINLEGSAASIYVRNGNILGIPRPQPGTPFEVVYQEGHPEIFHSDPETQIMIPDQLESAFIHHVSHQVYSGMNSAEAGGKALEYLTKYDLICEEIDEKNLINTSSTYVETKFHERGFV